MLYFEHVSSLPTCLFVYISFRRCLNARSSVRYHGCGWSTRFLNGTPLWITLTLLRSGVRISLFSSVPKSTNCQSPLFPVLCSSVPLMVASTFCASSFSHPGLATLSRMPWGLLLFWWYEFFACTRLCGIRIQWYNETSNVLFLQHIMRSSRLLKSPRISPKFLPAINLGERCDYFSCHLLLTLERNGSIRFINKAWERRCASIDLIDLLEFFQVIVLPGEGYSSGLFFWSAFTFSDLNKLHNHRKINLSVSCWPPCRCTDVTNTQTINYDRTCCVCANAFSLLRAWNMNGGVILYGLKGPVPLTTRRYLQP